MQPDIEQVERLAAGVGKPFGRLYLGVVGRSFRAFTLQGGSVLYIGSSKFYGRELDAKVNLSYSANLQVQFIVVGNQSCLLPGSLCLRIMPPASVAIAFGQRGESPTVQKT